MSIFKKCCVILLACLMLAGCNGQAAETTTEPAVTTTVSEETTMQAAEESAEADKNFVLTIFCPDKTIDLSELTQCEYPLENYYITEEYCYLAVSDGENTAHEAKKYRVGDEIGGLVLSECSTRFYYGDDYVSGGKKLAVDITYAAFEGEITLSGYVSKPEGAGEVLFEPDAQGWNGRPLILGKTDSAATQIALRDFVKDDSERVRAEVTLKNLLLKWNNGSAGGWYDYADVADIKYD